MTAAAASASYNHCHGNNDSHSTRFTALRMSPCTWWSKDYARYLTALIPLSGFLSNIFLLTNLLHYSTLPSLKIWSWPTTFLKENSDAAEYASWFTPEIVIQIVTLFTSLYLFTAIAVNAVGFFGVLKKHSSTIRFYRDCAIADLSFSIALTVLMGYGAFFFSQLGIGVIACEELSRNPVIMRSLEIDPESCERWAERSLLATIICMVVTLVIRLHAILLFSKYHKHIALLAMGRSLPLTLSDLHHRREDPVPRKSPFHSHSQNHFHHRRQSSSSSTSSARRVYLLTDSSSTSSISPTHRSSFSPFENASAGDEETITVFTPTSMSKDAMMKLPGSSLLTEAWVGNGRAKRHQRHHRKGSSRSSTMVAKEDTWVDSVDEDEGQIALPVYPGESLR